jgi:hypothetical protein
MLQPDDTMLGYKNFKLDCAQNSKVLRELIETFFTSNVDGIRSLV